MLKTYAQATGERIKISMEIKKLLWYADILEHTYYLNDSKRPAISESKQILYVTSRLLSGILCKQYTI